MFSSNPTLTDAWSRNKRAGFYQAWAAMEAFRPNAGPESLRSRGAHVDQPSPAPPIHAMDSL